MRPAPANARPRLLVMLSGSGRTLVNLIARIADGSLPAEIAAVVANRDCRGLDIARQHDIPAELIPGGPDAPTLDALVAGHNIDWIVLAGYLRLIPVTARTRGRIINIHPSLLPAFGGPGMHGMKVHAAAIEAAKHAEISESGCTVHFADEQYDTGQVILQRRCPVYPTDTPEDLAARVFALECEALPRALCQLIDQT
jgi:phosphoribosylglycinamide formyltransferase 1